VDLFDLELPHESQYHLLPIPEHLLRLNEELKPKALRVRAHLEEHGDSESKEIANLVHEVNSACLTMTEWVYKQASSILEEGKIPAVIGGDHSTPEGCIRAVVEAHDPKTVGILHIDAHADLREGYQGFERSHASIMWNVMHAKWRPRNLVQVGIRDFCKEEYDLIKSRADITTHFDSHTKHNLFEGKSWDQICKEIAEPLPKKVYISFDVDGLSPEYCPHTGTPVPGGLSFDQALYLIRCVAASGRRIVGFDLNEVAPGENDEWDGNVGARLLYKLCGWTAHSQRNSI